MAKENIIIVCSRNKTHGMKYYWIGCFVVIFWASPLLVMAQQELTPSPTNTQDTIQKITIDFADILELLQQKNDLIQRLLGNVELRQDSIFMYCDSAVITNSTQLVAQGNVIIQQGDSLSIFSDSLNYDGVSKQATLFGEVVLDNAGQQLFTSQLDYDLNTKVATYFTGALLTNGETQLSSKRGYFYTTTNDVYFRDSVIVVNPEFNLRSDTLLFNTKTQVATFLGPTLITSDTTKIYCEDGFYDTANKIAEFRQNAQFERGQQQANADIIRYDGVNDTYTLTGNASFKEQKRKADADTIIYNDQTDEIFLLGKANYQDSTQSIQAAQIIYNQKKNLYRTRGRSYVSNPPQILQADQIDFDSEGGLGMASGNVIWQDTSQNLTIVCQYTEYDNVNDYLKSSGDRPLLITKIEEDSLYLSADTLIAFRRVDTLLTIDSLQRMDTSRTLVAYPDVRIFKSDLQAICDSLTYSTRDSIFRFFENPLIWSDTSQFSADTIRLVLKDEKIDRIFLINHSFIINSPDEKYFNQIKGKNIMAIFAESELRQMQVEGNAESVYYALDALNAYIGVNKAICSEMLLYFGNNQINKIKFYNEPTARLDPMRQAKHEELKLEGFRWEIQKRPRSVADLLERKPEKKAKEETSIPSSEANTVENN